MADRRVLVVEDDAELRSLFRFALTVAGYDVRDAGDGLEALRRIDTEVPDAIVLDLDLPGVHGRGVLHDLKRAPATRDVPVIVVTGSPDELDEPNVACVLRKPITPEQLVREVVRCLARRSDRS